MKNPALLGLLGLLGPVMAIQAYAEVYMTDVQAASAIFPKINLESKKFELTPEDIKKIEALTDQKVESNKLNFFKASSGEIVFIDQVLGKHEFITFAVGIKPDGSVAGIEIIEYRETYGQKVREPQWRAQFVGKNKSSQLKLNADIKNISGATLSSAHITAGVKRILQTYDIVRDRI